MPRNKTAWFAGAALAAGLAGSAAAALWPFTAALRPDPLRKAESFFKEKAYPETIEAASHALEGPLTKRENARAYWLMAQSDEAMGRLDKALSVYQLAVRILPKDVGLRLSLGDLFERVGLEDRARPQYQAALDRDPGNVAAQVGLGDLLLDQGLFEEALSHFRKIRGSRAGDPQVALGQARSLEGLRRYDEAESALRPALACGCGEEGALWTAEAEVEKGRGDLNAAILSLGKALVYEPDRSDLELRRLGWLLEAGRVSQAAQGARDVLASRPDDPLARFFLGLAELRSGDVAGARSDLSGASEAAADQGVDPFLQQAAAGILKELGGSDP